MKRVILLGLVAIAVVLQISWWPGLRPLGVVPNGALVLVVLASLRLRTSEAVIMAGVAGVILDVANGVNFGLWTGLFIVVSLVCGLLVRAGIELDRLLLAPVLVLIGTLVMTGAVWLAMAPQVLHWSAGTMLGRLGLELVLNLMIAIALGPLLGDATQTQADFEVGG